MLPGLNLPKYFFAAILCLAVSSAAFCQDKHIAETLTRARTLLNARQYDSALKYADIAAKLSDAGMDTGSRIKAMGFKGKALFNLKQEKEGVALYFAALRLCKTPENNKDIAWLYGEIGYAYYIQGQSAQSIIYYKKQIALTRQMLGEDSVGNQLINISVMQQQMGYPDSAQKSLNEVGDILTRVNDSAMRGYYYFNLGANYTALNQPDSARTLYLKAYDIWKALGNEAQLFKVTFNLGYYYFQKKDYNQAIRYYLLSESSAKKFGMKRDIAHVYGTIAEAYAALADHKNAYKYLYLYATLNDSFSKEDINNYVLRLDKQFQAEKNRELIQAQELKLKTAKLAVERQRNTTLIIAIIFVLVVFGGVAAFGYSTFRGRVRQKVDEAKSRFFANVAHEIRTPLSMIKGPIERLQSNTTDAAQRQQLEIAARNTQRLNDLITQMLDISKIDSASYTLHESVGNIQAFADELCTQYKQQAADKNITFTCHTDGDAGNVVFDKDALEKIIGNLVGNALKYTPAGGSAGIALDTVVQEHDARLQINVWDTGPGIAPAEQAKIFERFYRAGEQQRAGIKGMGIGLSLVKELVALMNGTITVTSEQGKGTVFTVNCTLRLADVAITGTTASQPDASTILLVEDDKDILAFNRSLMEEEGYNVITAAGGTEATTILNHTLPDLIVTDLMMPGKDGMQLLREIRENTLTAHIPVIILSAKTSAESRAGGVAEGAQAYLAKPFSPAELKGLVSNQLQLLSRQKAHYQAQAADVEKTTEERFSGADPFTQKCYATIQQHLDDPQLSVERLAELMNINRSHFQRKIKTLTGFSPSELIRTVRLEKAREMLLKKEGNITETAYATGFTSQSYFTKCFSEHFGYPPSQATER